MSPGCTSSCQRTRPPRRESSTSALAPGTAAAAGRTARRSPPRRCPGQVHGHRREHAAAVRRPRARARCSSAASRRAGRRPTRGHGSGRLAARARAQQHDARRDHRRPPEVVVVARAAQRLGLPQRGAVAQVEAAHAVRRHHQPAAARRGAAEEAQRDLIVTAAVDRGLERAAPALRAVVQVEGRDLRAERRGDGEVVEDQRCTGDPACHGVAPADREPAGPRSVARVPSRSWAGSRQSSSGRRRRRPPCASASAGRARSVGASAVRRRHAGTSTVQSAGRARGGVVMGAASDRRGE